MDMYSFLLQIQNPALSPGSGSFIQHTFEIFVICLVMFLLGWFLHRLTYSHRQKVRIRELNNQVEAARIRINDLEGDLDSCNAAIVNIKGENAALSTKLSKLEERTNIEGGPDVEADQSGEAQVDEEKIKQETLISGLASDIAGYGTPGYGVEGAEAVFGHKIEEDDLKIVEGINAETAELLNRNSIHTWRQLGNTSVPQLQNILDKAGDPYQVLNPSTWPKQARMASDAEWVKLREYQDYLVGGVEPTDKAPPSLVDNPDVYYMKGKKITPDDLTVIEGIDGEIQGLLQANGIKTWSDLAGAEVADLQILLNEAGEQFRTINPATWPKQASIAAEGKWEELSEYHSYLEGGEEPS